MSAVSPGRRRGLALGAILLTAIFAGLGVWQVQRLAWKTRLIAQVEARIHASPAAPPTQDEWRSVGKDDQYRRLVLSGVFDQGRDTRVQAVTALGPGWWVMTPFRVDAGYRVLVNRGFAPSGPAGAWAPPPKGEQTIVGLLRISEPHGGFLRANEPQADRWRSRDVAAIAARRGLSPVAPYFLDVEKSSQDGWPRGGMTVVRFANSHLAYALTWFAMAALTLVGWRLVLRHGRETST